jgi:hypothetical protein
LPGGGNGPAILLTTRGHSGGDPTSGRFGGGFLNPDGDGIDMPGTSMLALAVLAEARTDWLAMAVTRLRSCRLAVAAWLCGSLGRGDADSFSDIDLIVAVARTPTDIVAGLGLLGRRLFTHPKPRNAPAGDGYLAVCVEPAGLPVLVDVYLWPVETAAVPADGRLLFATGHPRHTELGLWSCWTGTAPATPAVVTPQHARLRCPAAELAAHG